MENLENSITYQISAHCEQRYAERIMEKDSKVNINKFIAENRDKIKNDINKMISYGELIYQGKQTKPDSKGNIISVYLKDAWVILVDTKTEIVITLYKVDLGCGDDFNNQYITKMLEKLDVAKNKLSDTQLTVNIETTTYKEMLDESMHQISEYKKMIKNLENLCSGYQTILDNNLVKVSQANREVAEVINTLICKKEF